ncbi:hypothetical protein VPH35_093257 [Triticum aestivum]|uniref:DUF1618 domain-containing protein n=1 Tax=Triticum turgidum subsp. durum TaxID=4567 RepID=A0A9R0XKV6_TRITD|nr:uncharacterized protein LOC123113768 isoform X2 [Triticum aestivum]XP_044391016.1 uncharacterized protein LOC123113769 isoform X2 [Triticum aestivum]VAI38325.1 unnamed protein product [Triticum turgidum subsp. durum]
MPVEAASSSDEEEEEEMAALSDWEMAAEEGTDFFTDWAMEGTAVFPDWAMLDRIGRTRCHKDLDAARRVVNKNKTAAQLRIDHGRSCYVSFTLAAPPKGVSYLNLHWPMRECSDTKPPAYPFVRATDKDLVLFDIDILSRICAPSDLFVYTAAGPSPSVQLLPRYTEDRRRKRRLFLMDKFSTGILRLSEKRYIVADLSVLDGALFVFDSSQTEEWTIIPIMPGLIRWHAPKQKQSSGKLPKLWSTDDVLALDDRFLCWVDYFSGVLLSDFSSTRGSPPLHFVPFPGEKEYPEELRVSRHFPGRFRSVSISQGKMRFVHIDNDFHETIHDDDDSPWHQLPRITSQGQQHKGPQKITIWTLNSDKFSWEQHAMINLDGLWAQRCYKALDIQQRLPEFPVVSVDDPDVLCCLLREKEFGGKGWMSVIDMKLAKLQACTQYINRRSYCAECKDAGCAECVDDKNDFPNMPLLPTVFSSKHLERPTGVALDNDKVATRLSSKSARFVPKRRKCAA